MWMLIGGLILPADTFAQSGGAQNGLRIYVLQGEGAVNNTTRKVGTAPVVEVRDSNDFPVSGATVTFEAPATGPGVTFEGGKTEVTNTSDARGQASAGVMTPNGTEGAFSIKVTARLGERSGVATVRQTNSAKLFSATGAKEKEKRSFWSRNKWWLMGVGMGSAAGLGYYFATRDTSSAAVLTPGSVVIGGPR